MIVYFTILVVASFAKCQNVGEIDAVKAMRSFEIFNEFMFNWSFVGDDVNAVKDRILTQVNGETGYQEATDSGYQRALARSYIGRYVELYDISEKFREQLKKAVQVCQYYVAEDWTFKPDNRLIYTRIGFISQYPGTELNDYFYVKYQVAFPNLNPDRKRFFQCVTMSKAYISGEGNDECPEVKGYSLIDWLALRTFMRAAAVTSFGETNQRQFSIAVVPQMQQTIAFLPKGYKPAQKCAIWPQPILEKCTAVTNPKIFTAITLAENLDYPNLTAKQITSLKKNVAQDIGTGEKPAFRCYMNATGIVELINSWVRAVLINDAFASSIINCIGLSDSLTNSQDRYWIRDLFWATEQSNILRFARLFIIRTNEGRVFHMGSVFYSLELKNQVRQVRPEWTPPDCSASSTSCRQDGVKVSGEDALMKQYILKKAVDALTANS